MKALICEMCGSQDLVKTDGMFVCQNCGTKYTVEEAKKMTIEGTVHVVGTVSIDNSASYDRIVALARDAYNDKRFDAAYEYYCQAVDIRQDVVENILRQGLSLFAKEPIQAVVPTSCTSRITKAINLIRQMSQSSIRNKVVLSSLEDLNAACAASKSLLDEEIRNLEMDKLGTRSTLDVLADLGRPQFVVSQNQSDDDRIHRHNEAIDRKVAAIRTRCEKIDAFEEEYTELLLNCADINTQFTYWYAKGTVSKIVDLYPKVTLTKHEQKQLTKENNYTFWAAKNDSVELLRVLIKMGCDINFSYADVSPLFMATAFAPVDEAQKQACIKITKLLIENGAIINPDEKNSDGRTLVNTDTPEEIRNLLIAKNPNVRNKIARAPKEKSGCYVATCVYGSYDCPQVWTLRRFRDYALAETWYGRAFIHAYYAISPTLVRWFGRTKWFKTLWRSKLNHMVKRLNEQGFENTPYNDKPW